MQDTNKTAETLDEFKLRDELKALRAQIPDQPSLNPIVHVAFKLSRQLESGAISFDDLKALAGRLIGEDRLIVFLHCEQTLTHHVFGGYRVGTVADRRRKRFELLIRFSEFALVIEALGSAHASSGVRLNGRLSWCGSG